MKCDHRPVEGNNRGSEFPGNVTGMVYGIMFHHFHSPGSKKRPGSLSAHDFERPLDGLEERTKIVGPEEFAELLGKPSETDSAVMLSFDDSLRSQY